MSIKNPISPKVIAAAGGASLGTVLTGAIIWITGAWIFGAGFDSANVDAAVAAVPAPLALFIGAVIVVISATFPAYQTGDPNRVTEATIEALDDDHGDHLPPPFDPKLLETGPTVEDEQDYPEQDSTPPPVEDAGPRHQPAEHGSIAPNVEATRDAAAQL